MILAGDVGGTKTNLGLFERGRTAPRLVRSDKFHSPDFPGLAAVIDAFLGAGAGPAGDRGRLLRHPRAGDREPGEHPQPRLGGGRRADRRRDRGSRRLALINDLVATAEGIPLLRPERGGGAPGGETPGPDGEPGADRRRHRARHGACCRGRGPLGARPLRRGARRLSATDRGRDRPAPLSARALRPGEQSSGWCPGWACSTSTASCGTCGRCRRPRGCARRSAAGRTRRR